MQLFNWYADYFRGHRFVIWGFVVLLTLVSGYGYWQPKRVVERRRSDDAVKTAADSEAFDLRGSDCFLVIDGDDLFTADSVRALRNVILAVEELPYVHRVVWLDRVPSRNRFGLDEPLFPPENSSPERFRVARERALSHPLIVGQLIAADARTMIAPIEFDWLEVRDNEDCSDRLLAAARQAGDEASTDLRIRLTGYVPLSLDYDRLFERNEKRFRIIAYSVSLLMATIIFRGLAAILIVVAAPAMGMFWAFGLLELLQEPSNPLTNVVLPVLLMMVGLTDGVHLMVRIRHEKAGGGTRLAAAAESVRHLGLACALTSVTTAVGFGSLLLAQSEVIQDFGRACAIGVICVFIAVIMLIPLLSASWIGRNLERGYRHHGTSSPHGGWQKLSGLLQRRAGTLTLLGIGFTLVAMVVSLQLRPDDKLSSSQPTSSEPFEALRHCDQAFGGLEFVTVVINWPESKPNQSARIMDVVSEVGAIIDQEPLLRSPLSLRELLGSFPSDLPLRERFSYVAFLPQELAPMFVDEQQRTTKMTVRIQDLGIARYRPVFSRVQERLVELERRYSGFQLELTGSPVRRCDNLWKIVTDLAASLGVASVIILVMIAVAFRSFTLGLLSIVPNLLPLALTGTILYWLGLPLEIASVCSFTVCLGIAVDDTIHFLTRYRFECQQGHDVCEAVRRAVQGVGGALLITTVILVSGFATVLVSELPAQRTFSAMACTTITSALLGDLVFLPAMLIYFRRFRAVHLGTPGVEED